MLNQVGLTSELTDEAETLAHNLDDQAVVPRIAWLRYLTAARAESQVPGVGIGASAHQMQLGDSLTPGHNPPPAPPPTDSTRPSSFLAWFENHALAIQAALARGQVQQADDLLAELPPLMLATDSPLIRLRRHVLAGMIAYDAG